MAPAHGGERGSIPFVSSYEATCSPEVEDLPRDVPVWTATANRPVEAAPRDASVWTATGREVPVFFDHRGRRRPWVAGAGALAVVLAAAWLCGLVGGTLGFAALPSPVTALHVLSTGRPVYALNVARRPRAFAHHEFASARNDAHHEFASARDDNPGHAPSDRSL
jgi:hypothetical protein